MNDLTEFTTVVEEALHLWNNPSESTPLAGLMFFKNTYSSALSSVGVRAVSNRVRLNRNPGGRPTSPALAPESPGLRISQGRVPGTFIT